MASRRSLKDQLAELSQPAPLDLDPEDALAGIDLQEHRLSIDHSAAREHYIDVAPSALRKLHESASDPKYNGVRTSRKQLYEDLDHDLEHDGEHYTDAEDDSPNERDEEFSEHGDETLESSSQGQFGSVSGDDVPQTTERAQKQVNEASASLSHLAIGGPGAPASVTDNPEPEGDIASNLRVTHEADKKKGRAVSRQIAFWDTLLDARIQLQKVVTAANRLPSPSECDSYVSHPAARHALDSLLDVAGSLTEELFCLQEDLLRLNESIEAPARKRRRLDTDSESEYLRACRSMTSALSTSTSELEACYHPWLVETLAKWSAKVQAVAPNVLLPDNRGSFMRDGKRAQVGVVGLIEELLGTDGRKLLDRTRKRKDKHTRISLTRLNAANEEDADDEDKNVDVDVFDDTDYYQQLLRDIIVARGGNDGQAGEQQWQIQQRERKTKRKKTVDTKASKGRKLRYEVHAKLQNFMVPVPASVGGLEWHEEQIDGLFSSLLQS